MLVCPEDGKKDGPASTCCPSPTSSSPLSPSSCDHDFCRSCILTWCKNVAPTCPTCGCHFMDLVDHNERVVTAGLRSVTPPPIEEDEDASTDTSVDEKADGVCGNVGGSRFGAGGESAAPPPLPSSFSLEAAGKARGGGVPSAVQALNRQLLAELSKELADTGGVKSPADQSSYTAVIRYMGQLPSFVDGPSLGDLLGANVLGSLRLLLTPTEGKSVIRTVAVSVSDDEAVSYIPSSDVFRAAIAIMERINVRVSTPGGRSILTTAMLRDSLGLPKVLLWYIARPELKERSGYAECLASARNILANWSKQHCLSIVAALQKCGSLEIAEKKLLHQTKKRTSLSPSEFSADAVAKRRKVASANGQTRRRITRAGVTAPHGRNSTAKVKKIVNPPCISAKPPIARVLPKLPPPAPIHRAGKRTIRPVRQINISREELSLRQWRT